MVVSNRLPFSIERTENGVELVPSAGGLVSALGGYLDKRKAEQPELEFVWAGWPGGELSATEAEQLRETALERHGAYPLSLELRNSGVSKGVVGNAAIADHPDFVFAAGDDPTDEDLFRALPREAVTACVGGIHSYATYRLSDFRELRAFLRQLLPATEATEATSRSRVGP